MDNNDIIDFYKKADNDNKPEEPLKEQVETPEPVVSEAVVIPVPESNDPFDKFLFNLAEKLKTEKKITEQQQQQFNERVVQPTTNPEDPFAKFLESFAGLVKEDENINKEENIKEATIDFINKLKNDDFFDREAPKVIPKVKQAKSKSKKYLPPKFAKKVEKVEEQPVIEQSTEPEQEVKQPEPSNPYLKELQTADKKKNKIEDKISGLSDIKKIIAQQVQEQLSKYPNLGFTGGGGGTNAVQYAEGGTMRGDLNVIGKYLSGGVDISTLFGSGGGGGGFADRFVSGPSQFILDPDGKLHPLDNDLLTLQSESSALSAYTRIVLSPYGFFAYDNNSNSITFDSVSDDIVITSQDLYEWTFSSEGKLVGPSGTLSVSGNIITDCLSAFSLSANSVKASIFYGTDSGYLNISNGGYIDTSNGGGYINTSGSAGGNINTRGEPDEIFGGYGGDIFTYGAYGQTGGTIDTHGDQAGSGGDILTHGSGGDILTHTSGGKIDTSNNGGNLITSNGGGGINTTGQGYIQLGVIPTRTVLQGTASNTGAALQRIISLPNADGTVALESYVHSKFLPLSGGIITNNLTIQGSISALGTATFANTIFTTTSALSVYNTGPGPALYVYQAAGPYDVASFYDGDGIEVLHVGNAGPGGFGKVGVNESFPNQELTVRGSISATETIYANSYLSAGVNLLDIFTGGGGGGGVTTTKKFDFVTTGGIDYSYSGTAAQYTLETSPTWKLIRLTYANNGTISNQASAINSWTGRLTATYV